MDEKKLTIYFTSDLHGYIYPTDYRGQGEKELGLFKCASRFRKDGNTLVIDGGDILQGSPLGAFCHDTIGLCPHKQNHPLGGWMLFAPAAKKEEKTRNIFADFPLQ